MADKSGLTDPLEALAAAARVLETRAAELRNPASPAGERRDGQTAADAGADVAEHLDAARQALRALELTDPIIDSFDPAGASAKDFANAAARLFKIAKNVRKARQMPTPAAPTPSWGTRLDRVLLAVRILLVVAAAAIFGLMARDTLRSSDQRRTPETTGSHTASFAAAAEPDPSPAPRTRAEFLAAAPSRYVTDYAGLLPSDVTVELERSLAELEREISHQFIVYTSPRVPLDTTMEELTAEAIRAWGIGQAELDNGVILFLFPEERALRIEVGYGLEGILPDARAGQIAATQIVPALRAGDAATGVRKGVAAISDIIRAEPYSATASVRSEVFDLLPLAIGFILIAGTLLFGGSGTGSRRNRSSSSSRTSRSSSSGGGFKGGGGSGGGGGASSRW